MDPCPELAGLGNLLDHRVGICARAGANPAYGFTIPQARALLMRLKQASGGRVTFMPDRHDVSHLPTWVRTAKQITAGHLSKLASANGAVLATLDENIPGSHLIAK